MQKLLWFLIFIQFSVSASEIDQILGGMSRGERFYLSEFFKACIREDHFGYTIFFDKPVSASGFFIKCPSREIPAPYLNKLMSHGWKIWKKYEPLFQHPNYIFCEEIEDFFDSDLNRRIKSCHIYLINKNALSHLLQKNNSIFSEHLGQEFSPENLLHKIETTRTLTPHLNDNEALLGIVLGYGIRSSFKFADMHTIGKIPEDHTDWTPIISGQPRGCKINPVIFIGDQNSEEDQSISRHYSSQIDEIWNVYRDKEFLIKVIRQLCATTREDVGRKSLNIFPQ